MQSPAVFNRTVLLAAAILFSCGQVSAQNISRSGTEAVGTKRLSEMGKGTNQSAALTVMSPVDLYKQSVKSVVEIFVYDSEHKLLGTASGVVVGAGEIVTNKHVIAMGPIIKAKHDANEWSATVTAVHPTRDLAKLAVNCDLPPVPMRKMQSVQIGEKVFTIGAPQGMEASLSDGLVSQLYRKPGLQDIQTSAIFTHGSSGGGLFDESGKLIGITTKKTEPGFGFAVPVDCIYELAAYMLTPEQQEQIGTGKVRSRLYMQLAEEYANTIKSQGIAKEAARGLCVKAVKADQTNTLAWYRLGVWDARLKKNKEAEVALNKAILLNPRYSPPYYTLGWTYIQEGKRIQAECLYQTLNTIDPQRAAQLRTYIDSKNAPNTNTASLSENDAIAWHNMASELQRLVPASP